LRAIDYDTLAQVKRWGLRCQAAMPSNATLKLGRVSSKRNRRSALGSKAEEWFDPVRSI